VKPVYHPFPQPYQETTMDPIPIAAARDRKPVTPEPWERKPGDDEGGPKRPKVERPDTNDLLRRMRRVDPNQSRRYRQRTGE
jgi:hypothetical protein